MQNYRAVLICGLALVVVLGGARPASAQHEHVLSSASVSATCTSFTITVTGTGLLDSSGMPLSGIVQYEIDTSPTNVLAFTGGSIQVIANDAGDFSATSPPPVTWGPFNTNFSLSGTASLFLDGNLVSGPIPISFSHGTLSCVSTCPAGGGSAISSIQSNFNGTAIPGGSYLWFNASFNIKGVQDGTVISLENSNIQFSSSGTDYNLAVPNAQITFTSSVACISTTFDTATQTWITRSPLSGSDEIFLSGLAFQVPPGGFPGGINPVTWGGTFTSTTTGVTLQWKWSAAVYSSFTTDYNALGVKAAHTDTCSISNSDHAGTPENFKGFVIGGARGGGGSNWTGSWSGTASVKLTCP